MLLNICWWNTKLPPPVANKINESLNLSLNEKVEEVISNIFKERPVDLLVLCEVYIKDEPLIKKIALDNEMGYVLLTEYVNGVYYDFAVIYEETKIRIKKVEYIDEKNNFQQQLRIGVIVDANFGGDDVILFLSHWNSEMFQGGVKKSHCAGRLRDKIDARFRNKHEHLILMGDYNAQPFDRDMVVELETSKDIDIVFESPRVLYNPFWRNLDSRTKKHLFSGSYFNKKDKYDKWKTFDQMLFSSGFVHGNSWRLDIYSPEIHDDFTGLSFKFIDIFDHIPIYGSLLK